MRKRNGLLVGILVALLPVFCAARETTLPAGLGAPFLDNAILQQQIPLPAWGTTEPKTEVTVVFKGQSKTTAAQKDGSWRVVLDAMPAERLKSVNNPVTRHGSSAPPETAPVFKRTAFFFAPRLRQDSLVPIGIGSSSLENPAGGDGPEKDAACKKR